MNTGEKIRLLRVCKGMKQSTVASKLGITQQAYSKIEKSDKISDKKLQEICTVMGCRIESLNEIIDKLV